MVITYETCNVSPMGHKDVVTKRQWQCPCPSTQNAPLPQNILVISFRSLVFCPSPSDQPPDQKPREKPKEGKRSAATTPTPTTASTSSTKPTQGGKEDGSVTKRSATPSNSRTKSPAYPAPPDPMENRYAPAGTMMDRYQIHSINR